MLRPYQKRSHDKALAWIKRSTLPCVIEAVTSAGKSHIIAALASSVHELSRGKHVLCIAPSAELVVQNHEKYVATGNKASIFSASAGQKSLRHPVVFATPMTVKGSLSRFRGEIALIILDECHSITPTIKTIIDGIREYNPNVRVVGLSATPYRMNTGYIFAQWPDGKPVSEHQTKSPYFEACVDRITAKELLAQGYLTPITIGAINAEAYHTLHMKLDSKGQFDAAEIDRAFVGQGRKTAAVIADVVNQARDRRGVMIFAATVQHAQECMDSLPPEISALITGKTPKAEREKTIKAFKAGKIKYLCNVNVLTTGFDAPHVDVIALLRATESVGLLQQIIGRGMRIAPGKVDCLFLDYSEALERHCPDGDIFAPEIKVRVSSGGSALLKCSCPSCGNENEFAARQNDAGYEYDAEGYFVDLDGNRIPTDFGDMPAHHGRRCQFREVVGSTVNRCNYRWTFKECPSCMADNDIAARYCSECRAEIVDPNEKLRIAFKELKKDPTKLQTDVVKEWSVMPTVSSRGKEMDRIDVVTPYRSFSFWVMKDPVTNIQLADRDNFDRLRREQPRTITYRKDPDSGFFRVLGYNRQPDEDPSQNTDLRRPHVQGELPLGGTRAGNFLQSA